MTTLENATDLRVLIVEDDRDVRMLLGSHLTRLHCSVSSVSTGEECVSAAAAERPDVIIVDIVLPGMDGREVIRELRSHTSTASCLFVVTSMLDPQDLADLDVDALLPKPFSRRDVSRVMSVLRRSLGAA